MLLESVFVRFYKSFNYDYLRKHHHSAHPMPWDDLDGNFYPYVKVSIDATVTTVVGANESGKSHLLSAIEKAMNGTRIRAFDFCRYSHFFEVIEGQVRVPDFGTAWKGLSAQEKQSVRDVCGATAIRDFDSFLLFRTHRGVFIYLPNDAEFVRHEIKDGPAKEFTEKYLPRTFRIDAQVALPSSIAITELAPEVFGSTTTALSGLSRERRFGLNEVVANVVKSWSWFKTDESIKLSAPHIRTALAPIEQYAGGNSEPDGQEAVLRRLNSIKLAHKLIRKVAKIDASALKDLYDALRDGREGHVDGLI